MLIQQAGHIYFFDKNSSLDHCKRKVGVAGTVLDVLTELCLHGKKGKATQEGLDPLRRTLVQQKADRQLSGDKPDHSNNPAPAR